MEISSMENSGALSKEKEKRLGTTCARDTIVIVGAACRFPDCDSIEDYWRRLLDGRNCVKPVERWELDRGVHGGLLDDIAGFDAGFFRISPNEARCMDPQQRILMEVVHHALEDCGENIATLRGLNCGVFCTSLPGDYKFVVAKNSEQAFSVPSFLGNATSSLSGRISYFYDFKGPSITLDTACSSSLTAVQIACLQLNAGTCAAAIVGAVSVFSTSEVFEFTRRAGMLSRRGRCFTFSEQADGFVPSEGAAAVVLTSASVAERLGLEVLATIEAIELNHDGQSNGLMAPNAKAQRDVIMSLYRRSGTAVCNVGYVETHGTGTKLGDPIEMKGLVSAYESLDPSYDAYVGSSKSVIGHTLVCSGLASILKAMLVLRHGTIPGHSVAGDVNSNINLGRFRINREVIAWPEGKRYVAVSAFGFTGSNAHVLLGEGTGLTRSGSLSSNFREPLPFLFSAQSAVSLESQLRLHIDVLEREPEPCLEVLSAALVNPLMHYRCRVAAVASSREGLISSLRRWVACGDIGSQRLGRDGTENETLIARTREWLEGHDTVFTDLIPDIPVSRHKLPKYVFDRMRYWVETDSRQGSIELLEGVGETGPVRELVEKLSELLGLEEGRIDVSRPLRDYGVDSITVIQILAHFGLAGSHMQPDDVFDYPSLEALANGLAQRRAGQASEAIPASQRTAASTSGESLLGWSAAGIEGRPIVLLPPLNMVEDAWIQQIGFLRRRGYAPQIAIYPGHSSNPFGAGAIRGRCVDREAIVGELIDTLRRRFGRVALLGWSLGGCFALNVAAEAPELVSSMMLINSAARFDGDIFGKTMDLQQELVENEALLDIVLGKGRNVIQRVGAGANMDVLGCYYEMLGEFDLSERLAGILTRTHIIHGRRDAVVGVADLDLLRRLPNAKVIELDNEGHFVPLLAPAKFNRIVEEFLSEEV